MPARFFGVQMFINDNINFEETFAKFSTLNHLDFFLNLCNSTFLIRYC